MLLEEGVCYDQCIFLAKLYQSLPCFILYSKDVREVDTATRMKRVQELDIRACDPKRLANASDRRGAGICSLT